MTDVETQIERIARQHEELINLAREDPATAISRIAAKIAAWKLSGSNQIRLTGELRALAVALTHSGVNGSPFNPEMPWDEFKLATETMFTNAAITNARLGKIQGEPTAMFPINTQRFNENPTNQIKSWERQVCRAWFAMCNPMKEVPGYSTMIARAYEGMYSLNVKNTEQWQIDCLPQLLTAVGKAFEETRDTSGYIERIFSSRLKAKPDMPEDELTALALEWIRNGHSEQTWLTMAMRARPTDCRRQMLPPDRQQAGLPGARALPRTLREAIIKAGHPLAEVVLGIEGPDKSTHADNADNPQGPERSARLIKLTEWITQNNPIHMVVERIEEVRVNPETPIGEIIELIAHIRMRHQDQADPSKTSLAYSDGQYTNWQNRSKDPLISHLKYQLAYNITTNLPESLERIKLTDHNLKAAIERINHETDHRLRNNMLVIMEGQINMNSSWNHLVSNSHIWENGLVRPESIEASIIEHYSSAMVNESTLWLLGQLHNGKLHARTSPPVNRMLDLLWGDRNRQEEPTPQETLQRIQQSGMTTMLKVIHEDLELKTSWARGSEIVNHLTNIAGQRTNP